MNTKVSNGTVHTTPKDVKEALASQRLALTAWEDITPLARNEWLCWITSAKKEETREHRISRTVQELKQGKRRPCCWAGCIHR